MKEKDNKKRREERKLKKEMEKFYLEFGANHQVGVVGGQLLLQTAPPIGYSGNLVYQRRDYSHLISQLDPNNYNSNNNSQGAVSLQNFDPQETMIFDRNSNLYYYPVTGTCFDYYADTDTFVPYQ